MEGHLLLPLVPLHMVWTCLVSFLKCEFKSIRENLAFHFTGEWRREEVEEKSTLLNQLAQKG